METATITEAKNGLSALIDRVRAGQTILILDRGIPVARLEPVSSDPHQSGRVERLERAGIVRRAIQPHSGSAPRGPGPALAAGASSVGTLLDERRAGR